MYPKNNQKIYKLLRSDEEEKSYQQDCYENYSNQEQSPYVSFYNGSNSFLNSTPVSPFHSNNMNTGHFGSLASSLNSPDMFQNYYQHQGSPNELTNQSGVRALKSVQPCQEEMYASQQKVYEKQLEQKDAMHMVQSNSIREREAPESVTDLMQMCSEVAKQYGSQAASKMFQRLSLATTIDELEKETASSQMDEVRREFERNGVTQDYDETFDVKLNASEEAVCSPPCSFINRRPSRNTFITAVLFGFDKSDNPSQSLFLPEKNEHQKRFVESEINIKAFHSINTSQNETTFRNDYTGGKCTKPSDQWKKKHQKNLKMKELEDVSKCLTILRH